VKFVDYSLKYQQVPTSTYKYLQVPTQKSQHKVPMGCITLLRFHFELVSLFALFVER